MNEQDSVSQSDQDEQSISDEKIDQPAKLEGATLASDPVDNDLTTPATDQTAEASTEQTADAGTEQTEDKKKRYEIPVSSPVKIENRAQLDEVLIAHQSWLESVINPKKKIGAGRANLNGNDLSGFDLSNLNLSGVSFRDATLIGVNFNRCNLTGADFSGADLQGAKLTHTRLRRARFDGADVRDADFEEADLENVYGLNRTRKFEAKAEENSTEENEGEIMDDNTQPSDTA